MHILLAKGYHIIRHIRSSMLTMILFITSHSWLAESCTSSRVETKVRARARARARAICSCAAPLSGLGPDLDPVLTLERVQDSVSRLNSAFPSKRGISCPSLSGSSSMPQLGNAWQQFQQDKDKGKIPEWYENAVARGCSTDRFFFTG